MEGIIRPFQTRDVFSKKVPTATTAAIQQDVRVEFGRNGSSGVKTGSRNYRLTVKWYMTHKEKERAVQ